VPFLSANLKLPINDFFIGHHGRLNFSPFLLALHTVLVFLTSSAALIVADAGCVQTPLDIWSGFYGKFLHQLYCIHFQEFICKPAHNF
jgi:hypothetical protein